MARIDGLNNVASVTGYMSWINTTGNGVPGLGITLMVWAFLFGVTLTRRSWSQSALFASTVSVVINPLLVIIGLLNQTYYEIFLPLWVLSAMASILFRD